MWDLKAFPWKILRIEIEFESNFSSISQHLRSSEYNTFLIAENLRLNVRVISAVNHNNLNSNIPFLITEN